MNFKSFENILENKIIGLISIIALFGGFIADSNGGGFEYVLIIIIPMFLYALWDEHRKYSTMQIKDLHIPIVIKIDNGPNVNHVTNYLVEQIEQKCKIKQHKNNLKKYRNIDIECLQFEYKGELNNFNQLMDFSRKIRDEITKLESEAIGKIKFHLAYYRRPAAGFLIGTIFRTEGIYIYQNSDHENIFHEVVDINSRKYKEKVSSYVKYKVESEENGDSDKLLIVINSASHNVNENSDELKHFKNKVRLTLLTNGTIPYEEDWTTHVQEIYMTINKYQTMYDKIVIAHSMPEALSVALGMAIENYWNVQITQYNFKTGGYDSLYNMNQIEFFD